jgi:NADH-quinone oxidoreductase subunit E
MNWSDESRMRAEGLLERYPDRRSAVMPLLYIAMREEGRLTDAGMRHVAELTGMSAVQVEAIASFYTMFKREVGEHLVSVCTSVSCYLLGGEAVLAAVADEAGVSSGETTPDGALTVESVECIGACGGAPAVQVDYELIEGITEPKARELCRWLVDESPDSVVSDELQDRFGGVRSFDWGPQDATAAAGPIPAFGPYGSAAS